MDETFTTGGKRADNCEGFSDGPGNVDTARITSMRNRLILASAGVVVAWILSIGVGSLSPAGINRQVALALLESFILWCARSDSNTRPSGS
jgi:hypothetical protein